MKLVIRLAAVTATLFFLASQGRADPDTLDINHLDSALPQLSRECDVLSQPKAETRYFVNAEHREATLVLTVSDDTERKNKAGRALRDFRKSTKNIVASLPKGSARKLILDADETLLRYTAGELDYGKTSERLKTIYPRLLASAATPEEGQSLLYYAVGDFGSVRFTDLNGDPKDLDAILKLVAKLVATIGPGADAAYFLQAYLIADLTHIPEYRFPSDRKIAAALEMRAIAKAGGSPRALYEANASLLRDLPRAERSAEAIDVASALYPVAVKRLEHTSAERLRELREYRPDCWALDGVIEGINGILKDVRSHEEVRRASMVEALETVVFGTIQTETVGASVHFAKLSAVKAADFPTYRFLLQNHAKLQGRPPETNGVPSDVEVALIAGGVFEEMLVPDLAQAFYQDAAEWLSQAGKLPANVQLKAITDLSGFEWRNGSMQRLQSLLSDADALIGSAGAGEIGVGPQLFQTKALYEDAQLNDEAVLTSILSAYNAGDAASLVKDHLRGIICSDCGAALAPVISGTFERDLEQFAGLSSKFLGDRELGLLILLSKPPVVEAALREKVLALALNSPYFLSWKEAARRQKIISKKTPNEDAVRLWVFSDLLSSSGDSDQIASAAGLDGEQAGAVAVSAMLVEKDAQRKRALTRSIIDAVASYSSEFGGDSYLIARLDDYSRLLSKAGYGSSARVVTENIARLSEPKPDISESSSWSPITDAGRLQLAPLLSAVQARMARYAFEDKRWSDANEAIDSAMSLVTLRLEREWRFGNERAVILLRKMQSALRLSAQLRFLLAANAEASATVPGLREAAFRDLQFAMLGETALTTQAAARRRVYGDAELAAAVGKRDEATEKLNQLEALEIVLPSKLPWIIGDLRTKARSDINEASKIVEARLKTSEDLVALRGVERSTLESALGAGEALLILHAGSNRLFGYAVRPGHEPVLFLRDIGTADLTDRIAKLRREAGSFGSVDLGNARDLYDNLIAPAEALLADASQVIVVADGPIPAVPFAMLVSGEPGNVVGVGSSGNSAVRGAKALQPNDSADARDYSNVPWLIRRFPVSVAPNVGSIIVQRSMPASVAAEPFFGIGNPLLRGETKLATVDTAAIYTRGGKIDGEVLSRLAPLPETAGELRSLASALGGSEDDLLLGTAATRTRLIEAPLSNYRVLAFATHGVLAGEMTGTTEPGLILSPEAGDLSSLASAYFGLSDIMRLKLDAEMVILSACNTGGPDGRPRAESLSGLARGFISAGARQLIVTLWSIPSDPATRLTTGTVDALRAAGDGNWAKALQASMLKMIDSPAIPTDGHPASWAAFTILGVGG